MNSLESSVIPLISPFGFVSEVARSWFVFVFAVVVFIASTSSAEVAANEHDQKKTNQAADIVGSQGTTPLKSRWTPAKPSKTIIKPIHEKNRVIVKFAEGSEVRLRQEGLVSLKGQDLGQVRAVLARYHISTNQLRRYFTRPETALDQEKRSGEARSGRQLANLNLYVDLLVADDVDVGLLCDDLNALDIVELAEPAPAPSPPPVDLSPPTPDYSSQQGYRGAPPDGIGITNIQGTNGIDGTGMAFVDVEYSWQLDHEDIELPPSANIDTATLDDPFSDTDHGTAVLGEIVGGNNGYGVTGIAPAAAAFVAPANTVEHDLNLGRAINLAAAALSPGDVILLEQQAAVCGGLCDETQVGCGPVEWFQPSYDAITTATANGVIVVEAAGNGNVNLDDPACLSRFDTAVRDSGAIIVGAGSPTTHEKLGFSTYGSRVNVQGWGQSVTTAGYGSLFDPGDILQRYTSGFSGTSSASPIVTGAILAIQGARRAGGFPPLSPAQMRQLLINTGTPQSGSLHIGPLPDVGDALFQTHVKAPTFTYPLGGSIFSPGATTNVTWDSGYEPLFYDDMENGGGLWAVSHGAGAFDWALDTTNAHGGTYAWFASDPAAVSDQYLEPIGPITVSDNGQLSFWHQYNTEVSGDGQVGFDGGVVEISTDGLSWQDLGPVMTQNGYSLTISTQWGSLIAGREAFSGDSGGFIETLADLSSYSGQVVYIRFRMVSDSVIGSVGWYVDDVSILDTEAPAPPAQLTYDLAYTTNCSSESGDLFSDDMENGGGLWAVSHGAGAFDWALDTTNAHGGTYAWFASDPAAVSDQYLEPIGPITVSDNGQLSFWHQYNTEVSGDGQVGFDGGVVEISTDGLSWQDLGPVMTQNGYSLTISTQWGSLIAGREAFSGDSGGFIETLADLSSYSGQVVYIRFRMVSDSVIGSVGWYVDDVSITGDKWIPISTTPPGASQFTWNVPFAIGNDYCLRLQGKATGYVDSPIVISAPFTVGNPDSDGDGLSDTAENILGTNPNNVDSDNDGLVDGLGGVVPVSVLPGGIDIDGDGFVDGELDLGTDPTASNVGDVGPRGNLDNKIDLADLTVMTRLVTGEILPTTLESILGDINGDTQINVADLLLLQKAVLNGTAP